MSPIRLALYAMIALLVCCAIQTTVLSAKPESGVYFESPDDNGLIAAPVMYRDTMLIAVTDEGVAAIVFQEKDAQLINHSAKYRFRFLKDRDSEEITGAGIVLDTVYDKEKLTVKAGAIRIGWSGSGHDRGWIYYKPEEMQINIASATRFEDSTVDLPGEDGDPVQRFQKLDLKRFLK